jgi:ABC-type Fe3+-hydroxamate transport system substrate-binding protein
VVALVPSAQQRDLRARLEGLGIEVQALPNISYDEVLRSIVALGERVGRGAQARAREGEIRAAWSAARKRSAPAKPVRAVLILQREPLYVVGRGSFLDAMLEAAGAENLGRTFGDPYPRASVEWLIAAAPDLILDAADPASEAHAHWSHWRSLPAVANGRVETLDRALTIPGPYLDRSLAALTEHVRGRKGAP